MSPDPAVRTEPSITTMDKNSTSEDTAPKTSEEKPRAKCRLVSVEPVVFLILAVQGVIVNLRTQYIEARLAEEYNFTLPQPGNCSTNTSSSHDEIGNKIESETSLWIMYMKSISVFMPFFTGPILIAASDFLGRKPIFIINAIGHVIASSIFLLVTWFSLPLIVAVAAEFILGLSGDSNVSQHVSYAYVADTSTGKTRIVKLALIAFLVYGGYGISQILADLILQHTGMFTIAFSCGVVFAVLNFLYVVTPGLLLETVQSHSSFNITSFVKKLYKSFRALLLISAERRRVRMLLLLTMFMVYTVIIEAVFDVITIYGLGQPFCWSPTLVGVYNVIVNTMPALVALIVIKPLLYCMSGYWIMQLGFLSGMALQIVSATAKTSVMLMYVAVAVGCLRTIPDAITDNFLSRMVSSNEQGTAFALLSIVSSLGMVISPLLLDAVYAKMVSMGQPQLTFFIAAAIYVIPMTLTCILQICSHPYEAKKLQIQHEDEEEDEERLLKE